MSKHEKHHSAVEHKAEDSKKESTSESKKDSKILGFELNIILLLAGLVIATALVSTWAGFSLAQSASAQDSVVVSNELIMNSVESMLNKSLEGQAGVVAKVTDINLNANGLYEVSASIYQNGAVAQSGIIPVQVQGNKLAIVQQIFEIDRNYVSKPVVTVAAPASVKSDKPKVELFVWSFCPGGVYGESVLKPVVDLFGAKIEPIVRFIGPVTTDKAVAGNGCFAGQGKSADDGVAECCVTYNVDSKTYYSCALHNTKTNHLESIESERQACIYKNYGTAKLLAYQAEFNATCISQKADAAAFDSCWNAALAKVSINSTTINNCVTSKEGLGILIKDYEYGESLGGINQSPTFKINEQTVSPASADDFKSKICSAFNSAPAECASTVTNAATVNSGAQCS